MLNVKCQGCGAVYKLAEDLYSRKAAGFGVVVTCRRCKTEIHVEAQTSSHATSTSAETQTAPAADAPMPETYDGDVVAAIARTVPHALATKDETPATAADAAANETPTPALTAALAANMAAPLSPRTTSKATGRWPDIVAPTPTTAPAETVQAPLGESPAPARVATGNFPRPAPRPPIPKVVARKDPVAGPFVALSPGLLNATRPEPLPDSEAPVDSSDFIDESRKGVSPKAPPVRRPPAPDKPPPPQGEAKAPAKREGALPLKLKEPPKPPKQKPRAPVPSDDVSGDLLSADLGFDGAQVPEGEAPRIIAPDSSALAAPPPESVKPRENPRVAPTSPSPVASDSEPRRSGTSSRVIPIVLLVLGGVGAFVFAFRSQLPSNEAAPAAEKRAVNDTSAAEPLIPPPPPISQPNLAAAEPVAPPASTPALASTATPRSTRTGGEGLSKPETTAGTAPATPPPATTAPASGTPEPTNAPRAEPEGPFNADAARTALAGAVAQASSCRKPGDPSGVAAVTITFSPSGRVTSATIAGPPFAGTATGGCIAATLRRARVPAFEGDMVTVRKSVEIQ